GSSSSRRRSRLCRSYRRPWVRTLRACTSSASSSPSLLGCQLPGLGKFFGPMLLDLFHNIIGQRDIGERLGLFLALLERPLEEFERQMILIGRAVLAHQHVSCRCYRPALVTGLIGEDKVEILNFAEIGIRGRGLERFHGRRQTLAGFVHHV